MSVPPLPCRPPYLNPAKSTRAGALGLHPARTARRVPGRDGLGRHPPLPVLPSRRSLRLVGTVGVLAGRDPCGAAIPKGGSTLKSSKFLTPPIRARGRRFQPLSRSFRLTFPKEMLGGRPPMAREPRIPEIRARRLSRNEPAATVPPLQRARRFRAPPVHQTGETARPEWRKVTPSRRSATRMRWPDGG